VYVASNPEFLAEGEAVANARQPYRVVIGANEPEAAEVLRRLYSNVSSPLLVTDRRTAELIKHASNAFLATKISFVNTLAILCDKAGADVRAVARGMGLDPRVGAQFLQAGLGYGGSCFPKDCRSMLHVAAQFGCQFDIVAAAISVNEGMVDYVLGRMADALGSLRGKTVAVLGLSFKPNTSDVRESQAVAAARRCLEHGARVRAHDPVAVEAAQAILPGVVYCENVYECVRGADAVLLATAWEQYRQLDLPHVARLMRGAHVFDGRNFLSARCVAQAGLQYHGVGQGQPGPEVADVKSRAAAWAPHISTSPTPVQIPST
jgi:UDPglucose 6-dehydrogenase